MSHYYSSQPITPSEPKSVEVRINGQNFLFMTDSGVFSKNKIDFGTKLLIETAIADLKGQGTKSGRLLDLGCGYGVIGIVMKRVFPAMEVVLCDVNQRALDLCTINAKQNFAALGDVVESDGFSNVYGDFDVIMTNPPVRAGKQTVFSFYEGAYAQMQPGANLYVVLQKKQGAQSSLNFLEALFGQCDILEQSKGYRILRAHKKQMTKEIR